MAVENENPVCPLKAQPEMLRRWLSVSPAVRKVMRGQDSYVRAIYTGGLDRTSLQDSVRGED